MARWKLYFSIPNDSYKSCRLKFSKTMNRPALIKMLMTRSNVISLMCSLTFSSSPMCSDLSSHLTF